MPEFTEKCMERHCLSCTHYRKVLDEKLFFDNVSAGERMLTKDGRWWSVDEIRSSSEEFFTVDLDVILEDIINDNLRSTPQEIYFI